jgi:hypothetical protein
MKIVLFLLFAATVVLSKPVWKSSFTALVRPTFEVNNTHGSHYYHHQDMPGNRYRHTIINTWQHRVFKCDATASDFIRFNLYYCHAVCVKGKDCKGAPCGCTTLNFERLVEESIPATVANCSNGFGYVHRALSMDFCFSSNNTPKFYRDRREKMRYDLFDFFVGVPDPKLFEYREICAKCE